VGEAGCGCPDCANARGAHYNRYLISYSKAIIGGRGGPSGESYVTAENASGVSGQQRQLHCSQEAIE
jgi:hypothetical protein